MELNFNLFKILLYIANETLFRHTECKFAIYSSYVSRSAKTGYFPSFLKNEILALTVTLAFKLMKWPDSRQPAPKKKSGSWYRKDY